MRRGCLWFLVRSMGAARSPLCPRTSRGTSSKANSASHKSSPRRSTQKDSAGHRRGLTHRHVASGRNLDSRPQAATLKDASGTRLLCHGSQEDHGQRSKCPSAVRKRQNVGGGEAAGSEKKPGGFPNQECASERARKEAQDRTEHAELEFVASARPRLVTCGGWWLPRQRKERHVGWRARRRGIACP